MKFGVRSVFKHKTYSVICCSFDRVTIKVNSTFYKKTEISSQKQTKIINIKKAGSVTNDTH